MVLIDAKCRHECVRKLLHVPLVLVLVGRNMHKLELLRHVRGEIVRVAFGGCFPRGSIVVANVSKHHALVSRREAYPTKWVDECFDNGDETCQKVDGNQVMVGSKNYTKIGFLFL